MFTRSYQSSYCEAGREEEYLNSSMGYNMGSYNSSNAGGCGTGCIADQQVSEYSSCSSINPGHSYGMDMGLYHNHHGGGGLACEQESFYASSSMGSGCNMPCDPSRKFMNII